MSAVSSYLVISSWLLSIHLSLGRPLLLFPGTTTSIIVLERLSSSLLLTFPYQCNRFCLRNVDVWHTLASSCIIWFLTWSFLILPLILRRILISATCNRFSSFFLTAQHSAPYVIVGLITVLYTLSFSLMGTFLSHSTPVSCFHFTQASLTRLLMYLSAPPFESNIDPKYFNVVTVFSLSSPSCISSVSGIVVIVIARHVHCFCPADSQSMFFEFVSPYLQFSL